MDVNRKMEGSGVMIQQFAGIAIMKIQVSFQFFPLLDQRPLLSLK